MIGELGGYTLDRFIPFTAEVYFRLFERLNEAPAPARLALPLSGLAAAVLALRGRPGPAAACLAAAFASMAWLYQFRLYAELTPVGLVFGGLFLAQALAVAVWGAFARAAPAPRSAFVTGAGLVLIATGLGLLPVLAPATGQPWRAAQVFGLAPDPTVLAGLGLLLVAASPRWLLALLPVPLLWCAVNAATLHVLGATASAGVLIAAAVLALAGTAANAFRTRHRQVPARSFTV
jgi:hypothetical protein